MIILAGSLQHLSPAGTLLGQDNQDYLSLSLRQALQARARYTPKLDDQIEDVLVLEFATESLDMCHLVADNRPRIAHAFVILVSAARQRPRMTSARSHMPTSQSVTLFRCVRRLVLTILKPSTSASVIHCSNTSATCSTVPTGVAPRPPTIICLAKVLFVHLPTFGPCFINPPT